jgi:hypothetical protein
MQVRRKQELSEHQQVSYAGGTNSADAAGRAGLAEGHSEPERNVDAGGSETAAQGAGVHEAISSQFPAVTRRRPWVH